ncbi:aminotransferase-like domain-containing protein [Chitinophaga parva]|uniref:aminotransferase-like domain-containing protein n=1 Tax=Chitinophaga parva TaxID=2169414 RepID=UPI0010572AB7|nr:PLP-dependent aminotransferase family protein [Chitinophaga parva]
MAITVYFYRMKEHAYQALAGQLASMIDKGIYKPGEKLPSVRRLHQEHQLSMGTVLLAFQHLADKGLITAREKSGYFVNQRAGKVLPLPQSLPASVSAHTVRIDQVLQQMKMEGKGRRFVSFTAALPDDRMLPYNSIKRAIQQVSRDVSGSYLMQESRKGYPALREAIAKRSFWWKGTTHPDEVVITNGATEAILCCLKAVTKPGDTVLVQDPCYYGIMRVLECLELKIATIPSYHGRGVDYTELRDACQRLSVKACILVSNFNNPDGASISTDSKKRIAAFANEACMPVIEDDLYGELYTGGGRPDTIKAYDSGGWVMYCNSFTKTLVPGFRIGWCAAGRFADEVARIKSMHNGATSSLGQRVVEQLVTSGAYDRHLHRYRVELGKNLHRVTQVIENHFPEGTRITRPQGGMVLWIELPACINTVALQDAALAQDVAYAPGEIFSAKGDYQHYLRISYALTWEPRVEKALVRLGQLITQASRQQGIQRHSA